MLKIFRKDIIVQVIIILVTSLAMWFGAFAHPTPVSIDAGGPIFTWLTNWMTPIVAVIFAYLLVMIEGFLFNMMLYQHKMIPQGTLLPMFFYVLAMSFNATTITPFIVGSLMLIFAIGELMLTSTLLSLTIDKIFGATALVSIATLICPPMVVFFIPLMINMFTYSLYGWRDWTMFILGTMAPYIFVETIYFCADQLFYRNFLLIYDITNIGMVFDASLRQWISSGIILLLMLIGLASSIGNSQNRVVNYKKNNTAILVFLIGCIAFSLYESFAPIEPTQYAIPLAYCTTTIFLEPRRKEAVPNLFFIAIILTAIINNIL